MVRFLCSFQNVLVGWLDGFYVPFQLIYGYVGTGNVNDDDKTGTSPPSQGQGFFYIPPT